MLARLTLAYLALPSLPFLLGWVRPAVAVPVAITLAGGLWISCRRVAGTDRARRRPVDLDVLIAAALVVVLALVCGAGAVGYQRVDWYKHNAILNDLTTQAWPVVYGSAAGVSPAVLSYGIGYYLPAAVVGRLAGPLGAHLALLVWTLLGLGLVAAWVTRLSGRNPWLGLCAWLGFSGMDLLGVALVGGGTHDAMQWWSGFAQYSSNPTLLFWTPQHALAGWLGAALVVAAGERRRAPAEVATVVVLTMLWSPFVALGLVPLAIAAVVRCRPGATSLAVAAVAGAPFGTLLVAFLVGGGKPAVPAGWVWSAFGTARGLGLWAVFVAVEVGVPLVVTWLWWWRRGAETAARYWWLAAAATLVALPAGYLGMYNDLAMRASIPALFVLALLVLRLPWGRELVTAMPLATRVLTLALLVGAVQPATEIANQVMWSRGAEPPSRPPLTMSVTDLPGTIPLQYVSGLAGPYPRWLAPERVRMLAARED